ncbi:HD domain-containing protein [Salinimicrobium soli]|uniref:HD domain-containing protein n=1 Tax=Salinimicrobium soli TaxID=1254399 RepID=UPI003AAD03AB
MNRFPQIYTRVISKLESKLPSYLKYHNPAHTLYVLEMAEFIGKKEKIADRDLFLIKIAALYHDCGFIIQRKDHETISCEMATKELPEFGFPEEEIKKICGMIMATKIPQKPKNKLEMILADADLEYLGTDNFGEISQRLYLEMKHFEPDLTVEQWNEIQVNFLTNHHYHTNYCQTHREPKKLLNLEKIRKNMRQLG